MTPESIEKLKLFAPIGIGHNDFMRAVNAVENEVEKNYVPRKLARQDAAIKDELATELEELKREISDRYMELPLDADGVSIRVGDETNQGTVIGLMLSKIGWSVELFHMRMILLRDPSELHHVKPDPIKELLEEFGNAVSKQDVDFDMLDAVDEYAAKIRKVMSEEE